MCSVWKLCYGENFFYRKCWIIKLKPKIYTFLAKDYIKATNEHSHQCWITIDDWINYRPNERYRRKCNEIKKNVLAKTKQWKQPLQQNCSSRTVPFPLVRRTFFSCYCLVSPLRPHRPLPCTDLHRVFLRLLLSHYTQLQAC